MSGAAATVVVPMPHMGVSVEEGTVIEWLKAVGDEVAAEEPICAIATDKVDTEIPAPADGVLAKQLVAEGANVAVGAPLAELTVGADAAANLEGTPEAEVPDEAEEPADDQARQSFVADSDTKLNHAGAFEATSAAGLAARAAAGRDAFGRFDPKAAAEAVLSVLAREPAGSRSGAPAPPASPVARRMAAKSGIDLATVQGSGRNGRIRKADVEAAIASGSAGATSATPAGTPTTGARTPSPTRLSPAARPVPSLDPSALPPGYTDVPHEVVETGRVRRVIAEHMTRSRQTAAHMTTEVDVDLSAVVRARAELNATRLEAGEAKLSYLPFIARAACVALGEHPELNATFLGERMIHWQAVNLGIAVDTPEGLLVPVIRDCDRLTAPSIGAAIADLAERARARRLTPDDLACGTFTLSNPGSVGAVSAPAIINQPQVAILGVPAIQRRPWAVADAEGEEAIAIRPILRLAVTFDHRALDGADATRFAVTVKDRLEGWSTEAYT